MTLAKQSLLRPEYSAALTELAPAYRTSLGIQHHTILLLLGDITSRKLDPDSITEPLRELLLKRVQHQQEHLERSWQVVVESYAELKRKSFG